MEEKFRVLLVDDDRALVETIADGLAERGFVANGFTSPKDALAQIGDDYDALVTDLRMPGIDGLDLLARSRESAPDRPVIVMTAFSAIESAVEAIRRGAYHYLTKPFKVDELALFLKRAIDEARLRREASHLRHAMRAELSGVVGKSAVMRELVDLANRVADASAPVVIAGETGTGKGLFARGIHAASPRADGPFVTLNCAAVPENLLESELFGHVKGAFTGASGSRKGLFDAASGGTIFLDEIGEMPLSLQAKLLDVLERGVVRSLGADKERAVDARVIAATHRNLAARVKEGSFRGDLLFRLDVLRLEIPPLRQHPEDIPALVAQFLAKARARHPHAIVTAFSKEAMDKLAAFEWPGNVRELENVVERAVLLGRHAEIAAADLPAAIGATRQGEIEFHGPVIALDTLDKKYARWAIAELGGRKMMTAEKLGIDRKTLARLLDDEGD